MSARMQNVKSLEAHGYRKEFGHDCEGKELYIWRRSPLDRIAFGMCPSDGDTLPYVIDLQDFGFVGASSKKGEQTA